MDNTFASEDEVKNVDFIKKERYTYNPQTGAITTNITTGEVTTYDPSDPRIENQRCYVSLVNTEHSLFDSVASNISFVYEDNKFKITSTTTSAILNLAISNYGSTHPITGISNTTISLFGGADTTANRITYP